MEEFSIYDISFDNDLDLPSYLYEVPVVGDQAWEIITLDEMDVSNNNIMELAMAQVVILKSKNISWIPSYILVEM